MLLEHTTILFSIARTTHNLNMMLRLCSRRIVRSLGRLSHLLSCRNSAQNSVGLIYSDLYGFAIILCIFVSFRLCYLSQASCRGIQKTQEHTHARDRKSVV